MTYAKAKHVEASEIPVIDISALSGDGDPQAVAAEILAAVKGIGFFYVAGHEIPEAVIERAREAARRFFALPADEKDWVRINRDHRGFLAMGASRMRDNKRADYKESFVWGDEPAPDEGPDAREHFRPANVWPEDPPGFRKALTEYFQSAEDCAVQLMCAFALGLGQPPDAFLKTADRPTSRASIVFYPPQPVELGRSQFGAGAHTDFGCLTVLCQDGVGGLQVQNSAGEWVTAHPIAGTLVVNVGDLLARWSNGRFRSTPHRVVNSAGRARYSLVFAYDPNAETVIDPAVLLPAGDTSLYPPTTCSAYIKGRFEESFAYRD